LIERVYSEKSDVWSFGLVLVEIATRNIPYPEMDPIQVSSMVIADKLRGSLPPDAPPAFEKVFSVCQQREPSDRLTFSQICKALRD
jgi:integrin-linked kinase